MINKSSPDYSDGMLINTYQTPNKKESKVGTKTKQRESKERTNTDHAQ